MARERRKPKWLQDFTVILVPKAEQDTVRLKVTERKLVASLAGIMLTALFVVFSA